MARRLSGARGSSRRRWAFAGVVVAVVAVHGWLTREIAGQMSDLAAASAMPARIEVAFVRDMTVTAPPVMAAPAAAPAAPAAPAARPVSPAASAPEVKPHEPAVKKKAEKPKAKPPAEAPPPLAPAEPVEEAPVRREASAASAAESPADAASAISPESPGPPEMSGSSGSPESPGPSAAVASAASGPASSAAPATAVAAASAAGAASAVPFEWPVSTRVSYVLSGNYRGEVQGEAQVEWVRVGERYQVHLDLLVGPSFAPVVSRRMTSDGEITPQGLKPERYDQETKVAFGSPRRVSVAFDAESVLLANGKRQDSVPGLQDTASQFVQLTFLFTTRPELLRAGTAIEMPLALPHKVDRWTYDVIGDEVLATPFGALATVHLKPRRAQPKIGELSAEIWFAPGLRYLPVRIRVQQDEATYIDLMIARPPQMAGS